MGKISNLKIGATLKEITIRIVEMEGSSEQACLLINDGKIPEKEVRYMLQLGLQINRDFGKEASTGQTSKDKIDG